MTRAQGWRFLDMGQRIERALYLATFLSRALSSDKADNPSVLEAVLEVADCTITYRSRYSLLPNLAAVYDLVLLDDTNPRSLLFQLNQLVKHFDKLPLEQRSALPSPGQRVLIESVARLRLLDPHRFSSFSEFITEEQSYEPIAQAVEALLEGQTLNDDTRQLIADMLDPEAIKSTGQNRVHAPPGKQQRQRGGEQP